MLQPKSLTQPNVLLVTIDHWPGSLLGACGHACVRTPTLDQLSRNGVRFPRAYAETPVCVPARRTLMTGCPPKAHGDRVFTEMSMPPLSTMAQTFRDREYDHPVLLRSWRYARQTRVVAKRMFYEESTQAPMILAHGGTES
ncbi:MAG TPA: hypothetical protein EYQ31_17805 [Candidatus Handelsmanbacteria bacterium]|nr:hypothetical protein [Candidatus Handelsmanbacteria bacterium]